MDRRKESKGKEIVKSKNEKTRKKSTTSRSSDEHQGSSSAEQDDNFLQPDNLSSNTTFQLLSRGNDSVMQGIMIDQQNQKNLKETLNRSKKSFEEDTFQMALRNSVYDSTGRGTSSSSSGSTQEEKDFEIALAMSVEQMQIDKKEE